MNAKTYFITVQIVTNWATDGDFCELMLITNTEEWRTYMQAALDRGWPLAMLIHIHQKSCHFGEGSTSTSSHMNQSMEQENKDQNMHVIESEPQCIADQVREKEDQNMHVIQPKPQGLADEGERIPRIVEVAGGLPPRYRTAWGAGRPAIGRPVLQGLQRKFSAKFFAKKPLLRGDQVPTAPLPSGRSIFL